MAGRGTPVPPGDMLPYVKPTQIAGPSIVIGRGTYSEVHKIYEFGEYRAMKVFQRNPQQGISSLIEFDIVNRIKHPYVMSGYSIKSTPTSYSYTMKYGFSTMADGHFLTLPLEEKIRLFMCIVEGCNHLHKKGILHLDIKPDNCILVRQIAPEAVSRCVTPPRASRRFPPLSPGDKGFHGVPSSPGDSKSPIEAKGYPGDKGSITPPSSPMKSRSAISALIADFSMSKYYNEKFPSVSSLPGPIIPYRSPQNIRELAEGKKQYVYSPATDVWSLGSLLYYILVGKHMVLEKDPAKAYLFVTTIALSENIEKIEGLYGSPVYTLLVGMLQLDETKRTSLDTILSVVGIKPNPSQLGPASAVEPDLPPVFLSPETYAKLAKFIYLVQVPAVLPITQYSTMWITTMKIVLSICMRHYPYDTMESIFLTIDIIDRSLILSKDDPVLHSITAIWMARKMIYRDYVVPLHTMVASFVSGIVDMEQKILSHVSGILYREYIFHRCTCITDVLVSLRYMQDHSLYRNIDKWSSVMPLKSEMTDKGTSKWLSIFQILHYIRAPIL